jgi:hypothetical protein
MIVATISFAAGASPLMTGRDPPDSLSSQISLLHRVLIYAKEGSKKLIDGRWNLGQSESKLGIELSADETKQLMACTGRIVCDQPWGEVFGTAVSVLRPDMLVTAKHVFSKVRGGPVSFGRCSFRSHLHRKAAIPVVVEKDQRKGYFLNNEDFVVVRLKRELEGCHPFAINDSDLSLSEGDEIFSATGPQLRTLNKLSRREPVLAKGTIRGAFDPFLGGAPFYYADIDLDEGGSGGAVFALKDGRPVSDDEGRLILRGILVAHGPKAKSGQPYSEERNYTIIIGLQAQFRDLVEGKAHKPAAAMEPAPCLQGGPAKIDVISDSAPSTQSETFAPLLQQNACSREAAPEANANCTAVKELAKAIATLGTSRREKEKREFRLKNDTRCPICFTYNRCNDYGCWDEAVMASGKSTLFAGVGERAPVIKNPQFCQFARATVDVRASADGRPQLPLRKPALAHVKSPEARLDARDAVEPLPLPSRKPGLTQTGGTATGGIQTGAADSRKPADESDATFLAAKEKADREGVHTLTSDDISGLSLDQIRQLRGY